MAKSIRSKIKRKARAEFRSTIGTVRVHAAFDRTATTLDDAPCKRMSLDSRSVSLFRTFTQTAYNENMSKVQAKLKECVDKQSLKNLDHLSAQLATPMITTTTTTDEQQPVAATNNPIMHAKGENKVPVGKKKSSRRKHTLKSAEKKESEKMQGVTTEKRRPRFFCQF